ncbi:MAG TPA: hypothetical protein VHE34_14855 [Puia sp.]|uniref:hypothetical protein n=1 Tax=Puia sp. TaxID=2045100 RepID=UPI002C9795E5|nr:hypothetical protein [Puia sp.]HVU96505.1 hypothetical protein [Puia sp.]
MKIILTTAILLTSTFISHCCYACSMCKITVNGKTIVGNNEDSWRTGSKIWFEKGEKAKFGAAYVGYQDGFPQGGINEVGLAFDGFAVHPRQLRPMPGKQPVTDPTQFIKNILQHCSTVDEVKAMVIQYDRSLFNNSMLLFVDKSGKYLVMEVDTALTGDDPTYLLTNFCPSKTRPEEVKFTRYLRGQTFLKSHSAQATVDYGTALMDTMHECRPKGGNGTLYTSIYNLNTQEITLYFFHDFSRNRTFNLHDELSRGNHSVDMTSIFPDNKEYGRFLSYRIPANTPALQKTMAAGMLFYLVAALLFLFVFVKNLLRRVVKPSSANLVYLVVAVTNGVLSYFVFLLLSNTPIFYLESSYGLGGNPWVNLMVYLPLLLLVGFVPLIIGVIKLVKIRRPAASIVAALWLNMIINLGLLAGAGYWHLFDVI